MNDESLPETLASSLGSSFPASSCSVRIAIHDLAALKRITCNPRNYTQDSGCRVHDVRPDGTGHWTLLESDEQMREFIKNNGYFAPKDGARTWFLDLLHNDNSDFKNMVSLSLAMAQDFYQGISLSPQMATFLLGQYGVHHMPSTHLMAPDHLENRKRLDFVCQQPRWGAEESRQKWAPVSSWVTVDVGHNATTSIVCASCEDRRVQSIRTRLGDSFPTSVPLPCGISNRIDPFLVQSLLTHETFMQSDPRIIEIAGELYNTLDKVDKCAKGDFDRESLKSLTFKLHRISQDVDFLVSSTDIGITMLESMITAQSRLSSMEGEQSQPPSHSTSEYLKKAFESRKRWLRGARQRKETAMNLVYNLVAQQDIQTNMDIARDTRNDSSSMKAIAILTMIFLPASSVSSFFGMGFFSNNSSNELQVAHQWWMFIVVTVPVTALVITIWWVWHMTRCKRYTGLDLRQRLLSLLHGNPKSRNDRLLEAKAAEAV